MEVTATLQISGLGQELAAPALQSRCASRNRRRILRLAGSSIQQARKPWDTDRTTTRLSSSNARNPTLSFLLSLLFQLSRRDERTSRLNQSPQNRQTTPEIAKIKKIATAFGGITRQGDSPCYAAFATCLHSHVAEKNRATEAFQRTEKNQSAEGQGPGDTDRTTRNPTLPSLTRRYLRREDE